jgi:hypothetical protein
MDLQCVSICDAINSLPRVETNSSCCGHGKESFFVAIDTESVKNLVPILKIIENRRGWAIQAVWASVGEFVYFVLWGPVGAFRDANRIAEEITEAIEKKVHAAG